MRAILIGNGFTLRLNSDFSNSRMMDKAEQKMPDIIIKANDWFDTFRMPDVSDDEIYAVNEGTFCGQEPIFENVLYCASDGIYTTPRVIEETIRRLKDIGFQEPESIFKVYFEEYGLRYSLNKPLICDIETLLKVIHLGMTIGVFSTEDYEKAKLIANEIYYNNGRHGLGDINDREIILDKLIETVLGFDDVFTTNYDTILDDILEKAGRHPYHLHGGFSQNHQNKDPDGRYGPAEAKLIWGHSSAAKLEALTPGIDFRKIDFGHFRFSNSRLYEYLEMLGSGEYTELHIFGYSGENDEHINNMIRKNIRINKVITYVSPDVSKTFENQVRKRLLFGYREIELRSWAEFWSSITQEKQ